MMSEPLISVIMPVFNAAEFLVDSIESMLYQSFLEYELLIVDDGSTDTSVDICKGYAKDNENVRFLKNDGKGVVQARNKAVKEARGNYICFCDADDYVDADFLMSFVREIDIHSPDMVISGYIKDSKGKSSKVINKVPSGVFEDISLERVLKNVIYWGGLFEFGIHPYLWTKCIKRDLVKGVMLDTDPDIKEGEDAAIVFPCIFMSKRIVVTNSCSYHYRIHGSSVTHTRGFDYFDGVAALYKDINRKLKNTEHYELAYPQLKWYMRMLVYVEDPNAFELYTHVFPFGKVTKGSRIVLYGAGNVGKLYKYQVEMQCYGEICLWVDASWKNMLDRDMPITSPDKIMDTLFDCVVIAIDDKEIVLEVRDKLLSLGVPENKIVW